jgi:hypothetical protein
MTPSPIVTLVKFEQDWNANSPIDLTLFGMSIFCKLLQLENAFAPI